MYSTKAQEKFFRPVRIQVVECNIRSSYSSYRVWRIVQRNAIAGQVVAVWTQKRGDDPGWLPTARLWDGSTLNKGKAIELAKREAIALTLPFDPQNDVIDEDEITLGPQQNCVACGQPTGRAKAPLICEACKNALAAGRTALAQHQDGLIESGDLLATHAGFSYRADSELAELLAQLAGARIGALYDRYREHKPAAFVIGANARHSGEVAARWISLPSSAADAMQKLVDWINEHLQAAYLEGHRQGESVLLELASGKMSLSDLDAHQRQLAKQPPRSQQGDEKHDPR